MTDEADRAAETASVERASTRSMRMCHADWPDAADHADATVSADRRRQLKRMATRARARFTDAEARRFRR